MKMYDIVLFDLDGTIIDSGLGITNSVTYALKKYGIEVEDRTSLYKFIGPPLYKSFMNFYGFSEEEAHKAVDYYREYYSVHGVFENDVYEGIEELVKALYEKGKTIVLATSKPEDYARKILEHIGLSKYFTFIAGSEMSHSRVDKIEVIAYAFENCGILEYDKAIMIGDREYDIIGAKHFNMDSIGVLFGYGSREELSKAGATYIVENAMEILNIVK